MPDQETIKNEKILEAVLINIVDSARQSYDKARQRLAEQLDDGEITSAQYYTGVLEAYDLNNKVIDKDLNAIKIDSDYTQHPRYAIRVPELFKELESFDALTLKEFVDLAKSQTHELLTPPNPTDVESLLDLTRLLLENQNDAIVYSDAIGRLIDEALATQISSTRTEELAWLKLYQTILPKMSKSDQQTEISALQVALDSGISTEMAIKQRLNVYQESIDMPIPFIEPDYNLNPGSKGEIDVLSKFPNGELIVIAANKLVDNLMEGTQTVRHPMSYSLSKLHPNIEIPETEIFDEFCCLMLDLPTWSDHNVNEIPSELMELLGSPSKKAELLDFYNSIHVHTFQTYTKPKLYTQENVEKVRFSGETSQLMSFKHKEAKLNQIQASIQFMANNINNELFDLRDGTKGKQRSDTSGTLPDERGITWRGAISLVDSFIDKDMPLDSSHPMALITKEMNRKSTSLPKKSAFHTVLFKRLYDMHETNELSPQKVLNKLNRLSVISPQGATRKMKFFGMPRSEFIKRLKIVITGDAELNNKDAELISKDIDNLVEWAVGPENFGSGEPIGKKTQELLDLAQTNSYAATCVIKLFEDAGLSDDADKYREIVKAQSNNQPSPSP